MALEMDRRNFLGTLALGTAAACLPDTGLLAESHQDRPNVLFIASDDMNDWIGCLGGHPDAMTPNLDRLAGRSVIFDQAHCQAPICNPSRASLMTGLLPSTTGAYGNRQPFRLSDVGRNAVTLPQHFKANGYTATGSGKMYHSKFPDPMSWNTYSPGLFSQSHPQVSPSVKPANGMEGMGNIDWGPLDVADEETGDYKAAEYCIRQLNGEHDRPFFLACGFKLPHLAWYAPRKYFEMYDPKTVELPPVKEDDLDDVPEIARRFCNPEVVNRIRDAGKWGEGVAAYLACITFVDTLVGRLIDALDASPHARNTVIVFWGDHGWHLGEKLRWKKSTLWEEATRAPLMISTPGISAARCKKPVGFIDIYPTLADLCGLPKKPELEGQSLVPLLKNPDTAWDRPAITTLNQGNHSLRFERWRYTRYRDGSEELYDHTQDEMEWTNLAGDPAYASVKQELARWLPRTDAPGSEVVKWPEDSEEYRARIEALMAKQ